MFRIIKRVRIAVSDALLTVVLCLAIRSVVKAMRPLSSSPQRSS
jgi:hypothetical protein